MVEVRACVHAPWMLPRVVSPARLPLHHIASHRVAQVPIEPAVWEDVADDFFERAAEYERRCAETRKAAEAELARRAASEAAMSKGKSAAR